MARTHYARDIRALCLKALRQGATRVGALRVLWDISGRCQRPYIRELYGRTDDSEKRKGARAGRQVAGMILELHTPCRSCGPCKDSRRRLWAARAISEARGAARTWLGTLTIAPQQQFFALTSARQKAAKNGDDFDALPAGQQFTRRVAELMPEVTKFLKRVRKNSACPMRYLVVVEAHVSGEPHFHILLHEVDMDRPIVKNVHLKPNWYLGFSDWKLVTDERASYACKYLSKDSRSRVRASIGYGSYEYPIRNTLLKHSVVEEKTRSDNDPPSNDTPPLSLEQEMMCSMETVHVGED